MKKIKDWIIKIEEWIIDIWSDWLCFWLPIIGICFFILFILLFILKKIDDEDDTKYYIKGDNIEMIIIKTRVDDSINADTIMYHKIK